MPNISVRRLYQDNQHKLSLSWVASRAGSDNLISNEEQRPTQALVGHLNFIHPNRVQVLGLAEVEYLNKLEQAAARTALDQLFHKTMAVVIVANGQAVPKLLHDYCQTHNVPLMSTPLESPYLMDVLRIYLARALAVSTVMHGVFLDVLEIGVLIMGDSAMGKSELALELISRGHGLVADDAVELYRIGPETLEGRCPPLLRDFLEVRGLGILNIRTIFGETAVRPKKVLKLIIHLMKANDQAMHSAGPLEHPVRDPGHSGRDGTQGCAARRCRPQPGRAGRGRRAQLHPAVARHRQHARVHRPPYQSATGPGTCS